MAWVPTASCNMFLLQLFGVANCALSGSTPKCDYQLNVKVFMVKESKKKVRIGSDYWAEDVLSVCFSSFNNILLI